jgi:hypothetical protein
MHHYTVSSTALGTSSEKISLTSLDGSVETIPYHTGLTVAEVVYSLPKEPDTSFVIVKGIEVLDSDAILELGVDYSLVSVDLKSKLVKLVEFVLNLIKQQVKQGPQDQKLTESDSASGRAILENLILQMPEGSILKIPEGSSICLGEVKIRTLEGNERKESRSIQMNQKRIFTIHFNDGANCPEKSSVSVSYTCFKTYAQTHGKMHDLFQPLVDLVATFLPSAAPFSTEAQVIQSVTKLRERSPVLGYAGTGHLNLWLSGFLRRYVNGTGIGIADQQGSEVDTESQVS